MRALDKKLLRDMRRLWAQVLAISLVLACGVGILVMSHGTLRSLTETRDTYYERNRFGDIFVSAARAPQSLLPALAAIDGVARLEARIKQFALLDIADMDEPALAQVISLPASGVPVMNVPLVRDGRLPDPASRDEVLVNENFAKAHEYGIGDSFWLTLNGQKRQVVIAGTALSPEFIYTLAPGAMMPDDRRFAIVWMPAAQLEAAFDLAGAFNSLSLGLRRGANAQEVMDAVELLLEPYGGTVPHGRDKQLSNAFLDAELEGLATTAQVVPPIFLIISMFLVNMVLGRLIALEREQIGLLKALGYGTFEIGWHYIKLALLIGAVGVGFGWAFGYFVSQAMAGLYAEFFHFPFLVFVQHPATYAISALAGLVAASFGAVLAVWRVVKLRPAVAMSPPPPTRFRRGVLDGLIRLLRPSQPTMMIMRSLGRWPGRALVTTLGIATSASVMIPSLFMFDAMDELMDVAFVQVNRQDAVVIFASPRPESVLDDVANLPGVLVAEGSLTMPAKLHSGHLSRAIAIDGRREGQTLAQIFDADSRTHFNPEHGIVLARRLAEQLEVGVGSMIEVEFSQISGQRHRLPVTGLVEEYLGLTAYMDRDFMSALLGRSPQVNMAYILMDENAERALYDAVKAAPMVAGLTLMSEMRRAFDETIAESSAMITWVNTILAALIAVGVVYNAARIQLSERARELASLRILGFSRGEVSYILLGELMILTLLAVPLGLVIGVQLAGAMVGTFESDIFALPYVVSTGTLAWSAATVTIASLISALLVRRRIDRMDLVAVLKTRE